MTKTITQIPPDSTGDKLDMISFPRGADTVLLQGVIHSGLPSFRLYTNDIVPATNKYHIVLHNNSGSAQTIYITGLYVWNTNVTAVTGVVNRFNFLRTTGAPTLTSVTPMAYNSADTALANTTNGHTATAGLVDGVTILPLILSSEEHTAVPTNTSMQLDSLNRIATPNFWQRPIALRPAEGCAVKQIGAGTVGTFSWAIDFCVEPD